MSGAGGCSEWTTHQGFLKDDCLSIVRREQCDGVPVAMNPSGANLFVHADECGARLCIQKRHIMLIVRDFSIGSGGYLASSCDLFPKKSGDVTIDTTESPETA
jgi:hypothetical protein